MDSSLDKSSQDINLEEYPCMHSKTQVIKQEEIIIGISLIYSLEKIHSEESKLQQMIMEKLKPTMTLNQNIYLILFVIYIQSVQNDLSLKIHQYLIFHLHKIQTLQPHIY
jgi:hypothetical protein